MYESVYGLQKKKAKTFDPVNSDLGTSMKEEIVWNKKFYTSICVTERR